MSSPRPFCLHLIQACRQDAWQQCLGFSQAGDVMVLMGEAVNLLLWPGSPAGSGPAAADASPRLLCLSEDLLAHGLQQQACQAGAESITMADLVGLVCDSEQVLSWQ